MINQSHLEKEEREQPSSNGGSNAVARKCDNLIREKLITLREEPGFSNGIIARRIGVSEAVVSQYLSERGCIYSGDIDKFELKAEDFLQNEARRRASGVDTTNCDAAEQVRIALEYIRKTSDWGVLIAESGEGKTRGVEQYLKDHPTAILFRTCAWNNTKHDAEAFLFKVAGQTGWDNHTKRIIHAIKRLRGSERLIIVDDAHFLHSTALRCWKDIHEATQMPLAFCGVQKLLDAVKVDDQNFSRVGLCFPIQDKGEKVDNTLLKHLIAQLVPDCNGDMPELLGLCEQVAKQHGHYRSVHKQLKVAVEIKAGKKSLTWPQAFRAAHTMLVRSYELN